MESQVLGNIDHIVSSKLELKMKWKIENFDRIMDTYFNQACIEFESPKVTENNVDECHMRLYKVRKNITVQLWGYWDKDFEGRYDFQIRNNAGVVMASSTEESLYKRIWGSATLALDDFIQNFVDDNNATILCELITMSPNQELIEDAEKKILRLEEKYEALFNNSAFSDVSLISEGKAVKAHKCILANSSSVFAAMFDTEMKEKQENIVEIDDIKYDVLVEMVRYIYTGKDNGVETLAGELVVAADRYALDGLKKTCEKFIVKNLSVDNVIECLQIADRLSLDKLKEAAIKFIVKNSSDVTDQPHFKSLGCDLLCEICCAMSKKI